MRRWVVIAALIASCKRGAVPSAPEQDALWKLAPLTATRGIVISSRGLLALERGWRALADVLDDQPELVAVGEVLRHELPTLFPSGEVSLAKAGMTADRGAAFFFSRSGARLMFLPVVDRARFLAFVNGTAADGGDQVGVLTCKMAGDYYACANPAQLLGRIGDGDLGDHVKLAGARGDIELVMDDPDAHVRVAAVGKLERGSIVVRGAIRAPDVQGKVVNAGAQRFDASKLGAFGVFNVGPALASFPVPREPLAAGITLADLIGNMTGPIILSFQAGVRQGEIRVPMKDPRIARTLVTNCEDIAYLAILSSTFRDGVCELRLPGWALDVDVSVDGTTLYARTRTPAGPPTTVRPTAIANELATGEWAYAIYGRGTVLGIGLPPTPLSGRGVLGMRALSWVSEAGIGVRGNGNVLHFYAAVRTVWSYPDDVVAKWLALPFEQMVDPTAIDTARTLAAGAPTSPAADDVKAGTAVLAPLGGLALAAGMVVGGMVDQQELRELGIGQPQAVSAAEAMQQMTAFKDAMCTCKDAACASRVSDEMKAWSIEQARSGYQPPRLSAAEQAQAAALGEQMSACMMAALTAGRTGDASTYIAKNVELKDRLCACKDLACAEAVSRELTAWSEEFVRNLPPGTTMSPADDRKMETIENELRACRKALKSRAK